MTGTGRHAGRVALVTGARKGLGRALAEHLLAEGATVWGLARGPAGIDHPAYVHRACDVADDAALRSVFTDLARTHGRLDYLVNNAAVLTSRHAMILPPANVRAMVDTNLLGGIFVAQHAAKLMKRGGFGRIVTIGSMAVALEAVGDSVYAATKAAMTTFANVLAREVASFGITCNTLAISAYPSDMLAQLPAEAVERALAGLPVPRPATLNDVTHVLDFFLLDPAGAVTAQSVFLGGAHA